MTAHAKSFVRPVPYTMRLADGRTLYVELSPRMVTRDRDGSTLLTPGGVRHLDKIRAIAMRSDVAPSSAFIAAARQALGITQPEFARRLHKSTITVKRWETGTLKPSATSVRKLRHVLDRAARRGVVLPT